MENLSTQDTTTQQEIINLSQEEKELYKEYHKMNPGVTVMKWYEDRKRALNVAGSGEKDFYIKNNIPMEKKPDLETLKEMSATNLN